jgi:hypothetical protein
MQVDYPTTAVRICWAFEAHHYRESPEVEAARRKLKRAVRRMPTGLDTAERDAYLNRALTVFEAATKEFSTR